MITTTADDAHLPCAKSALDFSSEPPKLPTNIQILCEIVGATNLAPHPDLTTVNAVASSLLLSDDRPASTFVKVKYLSAGGNSANAGNINKKSPSARQVHTTKPIIDSNNPIWAVDTGSLFILDAPLSDFIGRNNDNDEDKDILHKDVSSSKSQKSSLIFEVHDKDNLLGSTARIGTANISSKRLLDILMNKSEERIEFTVDNDFFGASTWADEDNSISSSEEDEDSKSSDQGGNISKLALRFRLASRQDVKFIDCLKEGSIEDLDDDEESETSSSEGESSPAKKDNVLKKLKKKSANLRSSGLITDKDESLLGFKNMLSTLDFTVNATKYNAEDGTTAIRVKPGPDESRPEETTFLTEEELLKTAYEPSYNWVEAGSGSLGRVYVEVLRCQGLPNLDAGGALGNLTDSFVSMVFEDAMVQTDTIDDCLSPLWMPWTQRAFAFNMMHPLSPLYLAVFDYDNGPTPHDGVGRAVVNMENLKPNTSYTLKYGLYPSSVVTDRELQGTVTIRLRIEAPDEKALLMASRKQIPKNHVNVKKEKSLSVATYTVYGQKTEDKYDMTLLRSYVNEILEYKRRATYSIGDAIKSLILWRGQVKVGVIKLPLHSLAAFMIGTYVVERPHLVPSLLCFLAAWVMLANYTVRVQHPSPWKRCRPIQDYIDVLRQDNRPAPSVTRIQPHEGAKEDQALEKAWKNRVESDYEAANKRWEMEEQIRNIGDEKIHTEDSGIQIDPLARLYPIQRRLCGVCQLLRRLNCVITWEDSYTSFWTTTMFVGLGVCLFILPTTLLLHWICRALVWICLGPWMKFVDLFFLSSVAYENEDERRRHQQQTIKEIAKHFKERSRAARAQGEDAFKLKAMRMLRFGKFIAKVPNLCTRHFDYPLPDSFARPYTGKPVKGWDERKICPGQRLHGRMIQMRKPGGSSRDNNVQKEAIARALQGSSRKTSKEKAEKAGEYLQPTPDDNKELQGDEGIEIKLCESNHPRRRKKKSTTKEIREANEEEDDSSVCSYMLIPSHIITPSGISASTSVSSSLDAPVDGGNGNKTKGGECIEVIARYDESSDNDGKEKGSAVACKENEISETAVDKVYYRLTSKRN